MFPDIFSSFDPPMALSSLHISPENLWLINLFILAPIAPSVWLSPSRISWSICLALETIFDQLSRSRAQKFLGWAAFISTLFVFLIVCNLVGLTPFIFSLTSHLLFTLSFGLTLWLSLILSSFSSFPINFVASLLPSGAPAWLNPFLVLVETISFSVRPITLAFRLAANITAGHVIIVLVSTFLSNALFSAPSTALLLLLPVQVGYVVFELGICFIQAYIFCLLLSLYADEHP